MQNPVVVKPERLFRHYSYTSGLTESYREHLRRYAESIAPHLKPGDLLVEIGGNDGSLVESLEGTGIRYLNIDPSDVEQSWGMRDKSFFGHDVACRIREEHGPAEVVVANHVFAHVDDLHDMAKGVHRLLADDGVFFCEVGHGPNQLNSGCLDVIYHEHLSFHDARSFDLFLQRCGLWMVDVETNEAQGSALRVQAVKSRLCGVQRYWEPYSTEYDVPRIKQTAEHLRCLGEFLAEASGANADRGGPPSLAIYGAPAKLTTLLAITGLTYSGDDYAAVYDDSPRKVGRYVPGTSAPIRAPNLGSLNRHRFILIASWNFEREIRERWKDYQGTWIVPLPEVRFYRGGGA